ncbi:Inhibitor of growth protein [Gigaspora margarita]|uniref:Chromatin modification-related protein n=2 Tax=Gigaspora margarita TaxID=4874 RepID=A0A8H4AFJ6_GIGMA|nr:Inhibitor of growth protein [Gigaspora margarita]
MPSHQLSVNRLEQNIAYLDDYLDTLESLPVEMQRSFTLMQQLDAKAQEEFDKVAEECVQLVQQISELSPEERTERLRKFSKSLSAAGKYAEERVSLATATYDTVDRHIRRLDDDLLKFEDEQMTGPGRISSTATASSSREENTRKQLQKAEKEKEKIKGEKRAQHNGEPPATKKRKTAKNDVGTPPPSNSRHHVEKEREKTVKNSRKKENGKNNRSKVADKTSVNEDSQTVADMPIDPNEPLYCYCKQVSYGEMVACDNSECEIEWFHFSCVGLTDRPKGKWYCSECSEKVKNRHHRK